MSDDQIQTAGVAAIRSLTDKSPTLDFDSVHERSTTHRLAVYFDPLFTGWNVDCEYDRDGQLQKLLNIKFSSLTCLGCIYSGTMRAV